MNRCRHATLAHLTRAVFMDADLPTLMYDAVTLVAQTLAVEYSAIWEFLPDRRTLLLQTGIGWQAGAVGHATLDLSIASPAGETVLETHSVSFMNWSSAAQCRQPSFLRAHDVCSSLVVAIPGWVHPFGVFSADSTLQRRFTGEESRFLQVVAHVLALAIKHFQRKQPVEQQVEQRTQEIEQQLITAAQERAVLEERQRLARDLHDSVTQALYGITLHGQAAWRLLALGEVASAAESLRVLQDTAQEALDEMRLLIFELRPPVLEQVGLAAALQARLNAVEGRTNLQTRLIVEDVDELPAVVEQALYRIAQEALNNALRHANAGRITVILRQVQSRLILEIIDDGGGFDPAMARENGGLGLRGMIERVEQLGGVLTLESALGAGTQLRVEIAL